MTPTHPRRERIFLSRHFFVSQTVNISGGEGDTFVLTGWAKGDAVPTPKESNESKQRYYGIVAKFNYKDTSKESKTYVAKFNPDTDSTVNWQYSAEMMVAEYDYTSITVSIAYDRSANQAWFDGIQLFKEEFGHSYTYDDDGNVTAVKDVQGKNTDYTYDAKGNILKAKQDGNTLMSYTYDNYSNLTSSKNVVTNVEYKYEYDDYGNNTKVSLVNGTSPKITTEVNYTNDGNRVVSNTDSLGRVTRYNYDENTNLLLSTQYPEDTEQTATVYTYDEMYRMATTEATTDTGLELSAEYEYSGDYLTAIETPTTTYGFDYGDFGLRSKITAGGYTLASYNYVDEDLQEGQAERNYYLQSLDYGNNCSVKYDYDSKGRLISQTYEDGDTVTYHYDNYGALASVTDSATKRTTTYYYDFTDRLIKYEQKGTDGYRRTFTYTYDDKNNLSSTVDNHYGVDFTYNYTYDDSDRITKVSSVFASREFKYDNYGRTNELITTNGSSNVKTETYAFTTPDAATSTQIQSHKVYFGTADKDTSDPNITYEYAYDDNGNITSISYGGNTITYEYDSANQLIRENNQVGNFTHTWTYDNAGNITSRKEYAYTTGEPGTPSKVISYTYPATNGEENAWGDLLTKVTTTNNGTTNTLYEFAYDGIGNPITDGTWTYNWEHGRQLASMTNGTTTWNYTYNADGLRTSKTDGTTYYSYVYSGDKLTYMIAGGKHIYFSYDASGTPMTIIYNGAMYYYVTNIQGDVIGLLDANGNTVATYAYDAWGNPITTSETITSEVGEANPLRYRGYVWDSGTKLYYLQSRYYNPEIGRFINADGLVSTGQGLLGNNMFAYCGNNPVIRIDARGTRGSNIWSFKNDDVGLEILHWYLYGNGEDFPTTAKHSNYLKENKLLKKQVKEYLFNLAKGIPEGETINVDVSISVVIENGEDMIGYQYLHGTNADVGGFQIKGTITKLNNGHCMFKMTYTWNDLIDPNPQYASDQIKAQVAKMIPFANPSDYKISISWSDISLGPTSGLSFPQRGYGWLFLS